MSMNVEKIYENAYFLLRYAMHDVVEPDGIEDALNKAVADPRNFYANSMSSAVSAATEILAVCKAEMSKAKATPSLYRGAHSLYKSIDDGRKIKGRFSDSEGRMCLCDGYRAVRIKTVLEDIPECEEGIALDKSINPCKDYTLRLEAPSLGYLSAYIKERKAIEKGKKHKNQVAPRYDFGDGLPLVDSQFLLDFLNIFGESCTITWSGNLKYPLYFTSDEGDGILLPCKKGAA